jgi:hypothetical protein
MPFLRLLGVKMADTDLPKNWEGAARWFLGGTIVFASGFEAVVLFWEGKFAAAGGSFAVAILLMAVLLYWDRLKSKMPRAMAALTAAAIDARLWAIMLLALAAFAGIPNTQGGVTTWIYALPLLIGLTLFLAAWRYLGPTKEEKQPENPPLAAPKKDAQVERDLLILLDFAMYQSAALMLHHLIKSAPEAINDPLKLDASLADTYQAAQDFVRKVGSTVNSTAPPDHKTWRFSEFRQQMDFAEVEAEAQLKKIPPNQRTAGIDPLDLRRYAIANFQCIHAVAFLRLQLADVEQNLLNQRSNIYDQHRLRNPER